MTIRIAFDIADRSKATAADTRYRRITAVEPTPRSRRIQHVDTRQGPMERIFGLSRLIVFTAAGSLADAAIPGLRTQDAEYLRDELSRRGGDDGV